MNSADSKHIDNKYRNGIVYLLYNEEKEDDCYAGHTIWNKDRRLVRHKFDALEKSLRDDTVYKRYSKIYKYMRQVGVDKMKIKILEETPCKNRSEILQKEQYWMDKIKPNLNSQRSYLSGKAKEEYLNSTYKCSCGMNVKIRSKEQHLGTLVHFNLLKEAGIIPEDTIMDTQSGQYKRHRIVICQCGDRITEEHIRKHKQTKRHFDNLKSLGQIDKSVEFDKLITCGECGDKIGKLRYDLHIKTEKHFNALKVSGKVDKNAVFDFTITCDCGIKVTQESLYNHKNSPFHVERMLWIANGKPENKNISIQCFVCDEHVPKPYIGHHLKTQHPEIKDKTKFTCRICNEIFVRRHIRIHMDKCRQPIKCKKCGNFVIKGKHSEHVKDDHKTYIISDNEHKNEVILEKKNEEPKKLTEYEQLVEDICNRINVSLSNKFTVIDEKFGKLQSRIIAFITL